MSAPVFAPSTQVGIDALAAYPDRIDVRSPAEFALDHVPDAVNWPVLDDAQRAVVGTLHAQEGAFAAKRVGAALVARNIAALLEKHGRDRPRDWAPLVYCWRGGKRSAALVHILREIGWRAVQLEGGYQAYRRHVTARLATLPSALHFIVVCGFTGSGKSRLLAALADQGAQVLDLERIAHHRGSLLGDEPDGAQPTQKAFDSAVLEVLERCDPARPVFVESESRRIGSIQLGDALLAAIRRAACIRLATPQALRVAHLMDEYAHFLRDPDALAARLTRLLPLHGRKTIERWITMARAGDFAALVDELLAQHYDPSYARSLVGNFPGAGNAPTFAPRAIDAAAWETLAREVVAALAPNAGTPATPTTAARGDPH
ncbi:MAG: tRNA 2-selenouridine(34) synthase MnmH [Burkholderiales bacterium]|nr:tRNA 2-selenouridine(34) synthase MnmH [Burkholderiales bacterium]